MISHGIWPTKAIPAHSDYASSPKSRNTTSEYRVRYFAIRDILIIMSEFNQTDVSRNVWVFYKPITILEIWIEKTPYERNEETDSTIAIWENQRNQVLETFISMNSDAECNETTLAIVFRRFHEDSEINTKMTPKVGVAQHKSSS